MCWDEPYRPHQLRLKGGQIEKIRFPTLLPVTINAGVGHSGSAVSLFNQYAGTYTNSYGYVYIHAGTCTDSNTHTYTYAHTYAYAKHHRDPDANTILYCQCR